ncbi:MAG: AAA family ATPase [Corynebacterium sp.]|uniref:MinD/ParA family ATP-binding protein n=1 Tax=Corynebacterium sp. TaxID=1720 RepID=UPI0026DD6FE3|nr:AAA family ATPase [Corynebacterium sp.]MDO4761952.1 AAA family ATPase [Corynebacterium sp.]
MNNSAFTNSDLPAWLRLENALHEENSTTPETAQHSTNTQAPAAHPQFLAPGDNQEQNTDAHFGHTPLSAELSHELGITIGDHHTETPEHSTQPSTQQVHSPPTPTPAPTTPEPPANPATQPHNTPEPTRAHTLLPTHRESGVNTAAEYAAPTAESVPSHSPKHTTTPHEHQPTATPGLSPTPAATPQPEVTRHIPAHPPTVARHHAEDPLDITPPAALDQTNLVNPVKPPPKSGWRKLLHDMTAGHVNLGESAKQMRYDELLNSIREPLRGDYRIAVMSLKGGVGKTTTTAALGGIFAETRGDRVIAIDANPDLGTLAQRVTTTHTPTVRDLLNATSTTRYPEVRAYTTQAKSRLEVIGSERDPAKSEAFSEKDYRKVISILQNHYNVILTDCGTGLTHSAMNGVLDLANSLILATSPALDGAQSASATLDWLHHHGYQHLAANSVVVISSAAPGRATIDIDELIRYFRSRTRAVHVIPYDQHLAEGSAIELDRIHRSTRRAYLELAAIVAEDFNSWHRHSAD